MALFLFTKAILAGKPIDVFNQGRHSRDFTYVEDIVEGVIRASDQIAEPVIAERGAVAVGVGNVDRPVVQQSFADVCTVRHHQHILSREPVRQDADHVGSQLGLGAMLRLRFATSLLVDPPQQG